jgi:hypothetical protein
MNKQSGEKPSCYIINRNNFNKIRVYDPSVFLLPQKSALNSSTNIMFLLSSFNDPVSLS